MEATAAYDELSLDDETTMHRLARSIADPATDYFYTRSLNNCHCDYQLAGATSSVVSEFLRLFQGTRFD
jgi:hypothetical protein